MEEPWQANIVVLHNHNCENGKESRTTINLDFYEQLVWVTEPKVAKLPVQINVQLRICSVAFKSTGFEVY